MTKYEQEVILRNSEFLYFSKSGNGKGAVKTNIEDGGFIYFSREDAPSIEIIFMVHRTRKIFTVPFYNVHLENFEDFRDLDKVSTITVTYDMDGSLIPTFTKKIRDAGVTGITLKKGSVVVSSVSEDINICNNIAKEVRENIEPRLKINTKLKPDNKIIF